jgi:hypothetical protein
MLDLLVGVILSCFYIALFEFPLRNRWARRDIKISAKPADFYGRPVSLTDGAVAALDSAEA